MIILSIDSAMGGYSAGIHDFNNDVHISESCAEPYGQAENLIPMISKTLKNSAYIYEDIDLIAVTNGPGAFTGLRIGMACARSLSSVLNVPCVGVSTFDAVLHSYLIENKEIEGDVIAIILETKRGDFYVRLYDSISFSPISGGISASVEKFLEITGNYDHILCIGDACERLCNDVTLIDQGEGFKLNIFDFKICSTQAIAETAKRVASLDSLSYLSCDPVYLREPDAVIPLAFRNIRKS